MKRHIFWMIIGCTIPLLLIFFAPVLGLGSNVSLFIFILSMFACHLLMPMHHHTNHRQHRNTEDYKIEKHELHKH